MPVDNSIDKRNLDIQIYINGSFFIRNEAKISVFDSGFLMGDGIWEGLRLVDNEWIFIDEHLQRLIDGCKAIDIDIGMSVDEIKDALEQTRIINNMTSNAHARLMVTRGDKLKPFQQPALSIDGPNIVCLLYTSDAADE